MDGQLHTWMDGLVSRWFGLSLVWSLRPVQFGLSGLSPVWSLMLDDKTCIDVVLMGLMVIVVACYHSTHEEVPFTTYHIPSKKRRRKSTKVAPSDGVVLAPQWVPQTYPLELYEEVLHADRMCGYTLVCRPKRMWSEC